MASSFLNDEEGTDTSAYYAILNVPRSATQEEVVKAYRKLAQVFHPDKHQDEQKRLHAQESFSKVQEAYEVLSDTHKRQIYDVYGKQGLSAGLEVGDHLRSREEIRREWEEFKAKQARAQQDQSVVQKGSYVCRVDARSLLQGKGMGKGPLFKSVVAQSALEAVVADRNVLSLSGQAVVRPAYRKTPQGIEEVTLGGGNVMFGYKRIISEDDTLDMVGQVGLQSLVSVTSTRRLCKLSGRHGWINASWSPQAGVGMQVGCSQNLFSPKAEGSVNMVLGPSGATGVAVTVTRRGTKYNIQAKLEIGAVHTISLRGSLFLTDTMFVRLIGRLGTTGIDLELGLAKKWSPQIIGYVGTAVGYPAGVVVKVRATRAGQSLECPIHLSATCTDWKLVAASYVLPPLLYYAASKLVVQPLLAWSKSSAERAKRLQMAEATHVALDRAADEQALIEAVARRKLASELAAPSHKGLVVVLAVYGVLDEYKQWQQQQPRAGTGAGAGTAGGRAGSGNGAAGSSGGGAGAAAGGAEAGASGGTGGSADASASGQQGGAEGAGAGQVRDGKRGGGRAPPAPWLEVTLALQYLVTDGQVTLHGGVPKSGLMGFADPAPHTEDKHLYVVYWHQGTMHEVVVGDTEEVVLPGAGGKATPVTDNTQLVMLQERLQRLKQGLQ